jgi:hypothetical protein
MTHATDTRRRERAAEMIADERLAAALGALRLTERNLGSLIAARHCDAVLMTAWREVVRGAIKAAEAGA